jgi:prepilin-type processing-associated H-X9-DG protein
VIRITCAAGDTSSPIFPVWAGGAGQIPSQVTSLTAPNGNNANVNLCGYLPGLANVFRFMDGNYPLNTPKNVAASDISFGSQHVGGGNFLFVDGGVRFMSYSVDSVVYQALGTRSGGEQIPGDW